MASGCAWWHAPQSTMYATVRTALLFSNNVCRLGSQCQASQMLSQLLLRKRPKTMRMPTGATSQGGARLGKRVASTQHSALVSSRVASKGRSAPRQQLSRRTCKQRSAVVPHERNRVRTAGSLVVAHACARNVVPGKERVDPRSPGIYDWRRRDRGLAWIGVARLKMGRDSRMDRSALLRGPRAFVRQLLKD